MAQRHLNWEGCTVDKIFIDDFPAGRNDVFISNLAETFGYKEQYLHKENLGLSVTWSEFWNLIKDRNYDYVWHQEDDVTITSLGHLWTYPGKKLTKWSIAVMPEIDFFDNIDTAYGICSDEILKYER